jgi:hypothetical protein
MMEEYFGKKSTSTGFDPVHWFDQSTSTEERELYFCGLKVLTRIIKSAELVKIGNQQK